MNNDKISKDLKQLLIKNFGEIIDNVILFGLQLSEYSDKYSDYDWKLKKGIQDI